MEIMPRAVLVINLLVKLRRGYGHFRSQPLLFEAIYFPIAPILLQISAK